VPRLLTLRRRLVVYGSLLIALLVAAMVFDARCFIESRCFYFPIREHVPTPPGAEDVAITTPDGLTLHGWFFLPENHEPGDPLPPAILHIHGNAGHVGWHLDFSRFLVRHGFALLIFDFRGYGRSDPPLRALRRDDLLVDTLAALDYLQSRPDIDPDRIAIYGVSLGAVLGLAAGAERPEVSAVVSVSAFASWRGIASTHGTPLGAVAIRPGLDAMHSIAAMKGRPVLLIHGTGDDIVPPSHAAQLAAAAQAAGTPVKRLDLHAGHNDIIVDDPTAQNHIASFLRDSLRNGEGF
jgi:uncharacterized protein